MTVYDPGNSIELNYFRLLIYRRIGHVFGHRNDLLIPPRKGVGIVLVCGLIGGAAEGGDGSLLNGFGEGLAVYDPGDCVRCRFRFFNLQIWNDYTIVTTYGQIIELSGSPAYHQANLACRAICDQSVGNGIRRAILHGNHGLLCEAVAWTNVINVIVEHRTAQNNSCVCNAINNEGYCRSVICNSQFRPLHRDSVVLVAYTGHYVGIVVLDHNI